MIKTQSSSSLIVRSNQHDCTINEKLPIFDIYLAILSFYVQKYANYQTRVPWNNLGTYYRKNSSSGVVKMSRTTGVLLSESSYWIPPLSANFKISAIIKSYRSVNCCDNAVKNIPLIAVLCRMMSFCGVAASWPSDVTIEYTFVTSLMFPYLNFSEVLCLISNIQNKNEQNIRMFLLPH